MKNQKTLLEKAGAVGGLKLELALPNGTMTPSVLLSLACMF